MQLFIPVQLRLSYRSIQKIKPKISSHEEVMMLVTMSIRLLQDSVDCDWSQVDIRLEPAHVLCGFYAKEIPKLCLKRMIAPQGREKSCW